MIVIMIPDKTTAADNPLFIKALFLREAKKPGPTWSPTAYTKRIRPNSLQKCSISFGMVIPKEEIMSPTKSTQVIPKEIPSIFIFPRKIPEAITNEYTTTACATEGAVNNCINQFML